MMIGPAPMIMIVEMSVRFGMSSVHSARGGVSRCGPRHASDWHTKKGRTVGPCGLGASFAKTLAGRLTQWGHRAGGAPARKSGLPRRETGKGEALPDECPLAPMARR